MYVQPFVRNEQCKPKGLKGSHCDQSIVCKGDQTKQDLLGHTENKMGQGFNLIRSMFGKIIPAAVWRYEQDQSWTSQDL